MKDLSKFLLVEWRYFIAFSYFFQEHLEKRVHLDLNCKHPERREALELPYIH